MNPPTDATSATDHPDPALDEVLDDVLHDCHAAITRWRANPTPVHSKCNLRGEHEPVTDLDMHVQELLTGRLRTAWPELTIIAEEDPAPPDVVPDDCLLVDPIDGTMQVLTGSPAFSIAVCLVRHGRPDQSVVDLPDYHVRLIATTREIRVDGNPDHLPHFAPGTALTSPRHLGRATRILADHNATTWTARAVPTTSVKMALVALGRASAAVYLTTQGGGAAPWDYAASALAVASSGGTVRDASGRDLARTPPVPITGWCASAPGIVLPPLPWTEI